MYLGLECQTLVWHMYGDKYDASDLVLGHQQEARLHRFRILQSRISHGSLVAGRIATQCSTEVVAER